MTKQLSELESWFHRHCDGDWEHEFGIKIETLDNPGWCLTIPLERTELENEPFKTVSIERTELDWILCKKEKGRFEGYGGSKNLEELISRFLLFANSVTSKGKS